MWLKHCILRIGNAAMPIEFKLIELTFKIPTAQVFLKYKEVFFIYQKGKRKYKSLSGRGYTILK